MVYLWTDALFTFGAWLWSHKPYSQALLNESVLQKVFKIIMIQRYDPRIWLLNQDEEVGPLGVPYQPRTSEIIEKEIEESAGRWIMR